MGDTKCIEILTEQKNILAEEEKILINMCRSEQEKRYNETGRIDYTRTAIRIPLNKKINSYYDDFVLEVLFYDDVCTPKGKYSEYKTMDTLEERNAFLRQNLSITHMGLALLRKEQTDLLACIGLLGKQNPRDPKVLEGHITLLPHKFSDFNNLHLSDLNEIKNNDLRQILQDRIDLDKENMELIAAETIRGSEYRLLKYSNRNHKDYYIEQPKEELYIRYVCDSTGRVYYNLLDIENLKISKYFKSSEPKTYLESWWNITHLGASIDGKPVVAC